MQLRSIVAAIKYESANWLLKVRWFVYCIVLSICFFSYEYICILRRPEVEENFYDYCRFERNSSISLRPPSSLSSLMSSLLSNSGAGSAASIHSSIVADSPERSEGENFWCFVKWRWILLVFLPIPTQHHVLIPLVIHSNFHSIPSRISSTPPSTPERSEGEKFGRLCTQRGEIKRFSAGFLWSSCVERGYELDPAVLVTSISSHLVAERAKWAKRIFRV